MFDIPGYLQERLSNPQISGDGDELCASCPNCESRKFYANRKTGHYVCFSCEYRGRSITRLIMTLEGLTWAEALKFLGAKDVPERREPLVDLVDHANRFFKIKPKDEYIAVPHPDHFALCKRVPTYLHRRGLDKRTIQHWRVGVCEEGYYAGRVIVPVRCPFGGSFTARDATGTSKIKYLNPKGINHRRLLIGWSTVDWDSTTTLIICEGPFDAMKLQQYGHSAVALGGKVLHRPQYELLSKLDPGIAMMVMLDPEETVACEAVGRQLAMRFRRVRIAKLPDDVDPGSATKSQVAMSLLTSRKALGSELGLLLARFRER